MAAQIAAQNGFADGGDISVVVNSPPATGPNAGDPDAAEVLIVRAVPTNFMTVLGVSTVSVEARAVALARQVLPPAAFLVLDETASPALQLDEHATINITNGDVHVNSSAAQAVLVKQNAGISASSTSVVSGVTVSGWINPAATTGSLAIPDPLAAVPVPVVGGPNLGSVTATSSGSPNVTISPGIYTNITATNNGTMTFNPGTYVVTGTLNANNNGWLVGNGVTIYFACLAYPAPCAAG